MIKTFTFIGILILLAVVFAVWSGTPWMGQGHEHSFVWPGDGSDWNFNGNHWAGWIIGALALLPVLVPLLILLARPVLAIYGLAKLFSKRTV